MAKEYTVDKMIDEKLARTELYRAMLSSGNYEDRRAILDTMLEMRQRIRDGEDPEEVLYEEGFEPDFVLDLI